MANMSSELDMFGRSLTPNSSSQRPSSVFRRMHQQVALMNNNQGQVQLQNGGGGYQQQSIVPAAYAPYQQLHSMGVTTLSQAVAAAVGLMQNEVEDQEDEEDQLPPDNDLEELGIRNVWGWNLRKEFKELRPLVAKGYNFIAVDTEFPGAPIRPVGEFRYPYDFAYQMLRLNCDVLHVIQIGITLMGENGKLPNGIHTWQFNFRFSLSTEMYASDSIELLQAAGIKFDRMERHGINPTEFSELLISSGLVLNEDVRWISFHSGYDFGYLYRNLTNKDLPQEVKEFYENLKLYFPFVYDVKYLMKSCRNLKGGLQELAIDLQVARLGTSHQAGSDALLTGQIFFKMREAFFENMIDDKKFNGRLYGLTGSYYDPDEVNPPLSQSESETEQGKTGAMSTGDGPRLESGLSTAESYLTDNYSTNEVNSSATASSEDNSHLYNGEASSLESQAVEVALQKMENMLANITKFN